MSSHLEFNVPTVIVANEVKYVKWNDSHSFHLYISLVLDDDILSGPFSVSFFATAIRSSGFLVNFSGLQCTLRTSWRP